MEANTTVYSKLNYSVSRYVRKRFEGLEFCSLLNPLSLKTKGKSVTVVHNTMKVNM
jgi:hypothetical protein